LIRLLVRSDGIRNIDVVSQAPPVSRSPGRRTPDGRPHVVPTPEQMIAWRAFLRSHAAVTKALEAELIAGQRLSLASYDVLVQLAEAPDRRLRMTELADAVLLSRSGVTRLVDRLERVGLVARYPVAEDGRGVAASLTEKGVDRLRAASRTHLAGVVRHFADKLEPEDLAALVRIAGRLEA
jgi:DNA-binding MarR family transcriptional regulator